MMRTLVTGAAGFIGSNLVDRLLAEGHQVIGIDNLSTGRAENLEQALRFNRLLPGRFKFLQVDVRAPELKGIVAGTNPDVIVHLAAQTDVRASVRDPQFDAHNNVLGTINVCEASRDAGVQRIVYAACGGTRHGEPTCPLSPYAVSKLGGELYLRAYAEIYGIMPICLALANVYGPRQDTRGEAGVIAVLSNAIATGRDITVDGEDTATLDFVYVDDVVEAFVSAGRAGVGASGVYNIGTGRQTSVAEVHQLIRAVYGGSRAPCYAKRTGEPRTIASDATRAEMELGWKPTVRLFDGIERTMRWLRGSPASDPSPVGVVRRPRSDRAAMRARVVSTALT